MIHPERIVLIAIMAGIVSAGFTWFGWELIQNIFAVLRRRPQTPRAGEQKAQDAAEKARQKPAAPREVKQKVG